MSISNPLLSLPPPVWLEIIELSKGAGQDTQHPIFRVSQQGRDAVLRWAKNAKLQIYQSDSPEGLAPLARLLARLKAVGSCSSLTLLVSGTETKKGHDMLAVLLEPCLGWSSLQVLHLTGWSLNRASATLMASTFPCLRKLLLTRVDLGSAEVLNKLQVLSQLSVVEMVECSLDDDAEAYSNAALALRGLTTLRELQIHGEGIPPELTSGLTQLTRLELAHMVAVFPSLFRLSQSMPHLESLALAVDGSCSAEMLAQLLTTCTCLKSLSLSCDISQPEFGAILTFGTQLTSLSVHWLTLSRSTARASCNLRAIKWATGDWDEGKPNDIRTMAYLPLGVIESLTVHHECDIGLPAVVFHECRLPGNEWRLPLHAPGTTHSELCELVHEAALNLAKCPAWRASQPQAELVLQAYGSNRVPSDMDDSARLKLLGALHPLLSGLTNLQIDMPGFLMGQPEVAALGTACGSTLKHLAILTAHVQTTFWPAVWSHLPALGTLSLGYNAWCGHDAIAASSLCLFCSHATRHLTLKIDEHLYNNLECEELQQCWGLWSSPPLVTVCRTILRPDWALHV